MARNIEQDSLLETQLESEVVFQGKLLEVRRDRVLLPDQSTAFREYIVHPGAVVIIARLPSGALLFERQFRYPVGRSFLELPAGKIDPGESIDDTARRELAEETGYLAGCWSHLGTMHPCIGYSNERIEVFLADELELQEGGSTLDEGEFLEVLSLTWAEVDEAIRGGRITDAKTITALYLAKVTIG